MVDDGGQASNATCGVAVLKEGLVEEEATVVPVVVGEGVGCICKFDAPV